MDEAEWTRLQEGIEHADLKTRIWLTSWFASSLARRPDILEHLWNGSRDADAVGWRWCEYRYADRSTFPRVFDLLYGDYLHRMPTAPVFVLRATCSRCGEPGFFLSCNVSKDDREARGVPRGRCAQCTRRAAGRWRGPRSSDRRGRR